jgi:hypothetical protein
VSGVAQIHVRLTHHEEGIENNHPHHQILQWLTTSTILFKADTEVYLDSFVVHVACLGLVR